MEADADTGTGDSWWRPYDAGILLRVRAVPNGRRDEIVGVVDGALKVKLSAPPVDGKANDALLRLVVQEFGVRRSQVRVRAGSTARRKTVQISGIDAPPTSLSRRVEGS